MTINQEVLTGRWHEVRGKIKQKWGQLSDDELRSFEGNVDELVGRIQRKTGESREAVEHFLAQMSQEGSEAAGQFGKRVQQGAQKAMEAGSRAVDDIGDRVSHQAANVRETARQGYESLREGYGEAERVVQEHPGQALAVAFGLGLLAGVGVSLLLFNGRSHASSSTARATAEHYGRQLRDALANLMPTRG